VNNTPDCLDSVKSHWWTQQWI